MRASFLAIITCATAVTTALGQGTVNFSNLSTALSSPPDRLIRFGPNSSGIPAGTPASTNLFPGLVAQLYYGASTAVETSLVAVSTAARTLRASTSASVGTWFPGTGTLTGFNPGDTVNLQVRVWDIRAGNDYFTALTGGNYSSILLTKIAGASPRSSNTHYPRIRRLLRLSST